MWLATLSTYIPNHKPTPEQESFCACLKIQVLISSYRFQFDAPPQAGAIYTSGFSLCSNNSLALGGSAIWYQCYSGGFYNLYTESLSDVHCNQIYMVAVNSGGVSQQSDGQPGVSTQAPAYPAPSATGPVISQISDAQPQVPTNPASPISSAPAVISQISDGQPQAPTSPAVISQISDGQPQVPTGPVISQIRYVNNNLQCLCERTCSNRIVAMASLKPLLVRSSLRSGMYMMTFCGVSPRNVC
jgi:hypothetical protein